MLNEILRRIRNEVVISPNDAKVADFIEEIEECINFFDKSKPEDRKKNSTLSIHSNKITLGTENTKEKNYFLTRDVLYVPGFPLHKEILSVNRKRVIRLRKSHIDGKIIGSENGEVVSKKELEEVLGLVHNITFPYSNHIKSNKK